MGSPCLGENRVGVSEGVLGFELQRFVAFAQSFLMAGYFRMPRFSKLFVFTMLPPPRSSFNIVVYYAVDRELAHGFEFDISLPVYTIYIKPSYAICSNI